MESNTTFQVTLKNNKKVLLVSENETVYEAALKLGIQLPIGCKYGGCITCAAKLVSGKVKQLGATAINKRQAKAGYILLCVAVPKSDCIIEEGVKSHDQLYQNPFFSKNYKR